LQDRSELAEIDRLMGEFFADQGEKMAAFEQDKAMRDVGRVAREHQVVFAHAFSFKRRGNDTSITVLKDEVDWKQKLNIVLGLSPELPTSSVRESKPSDGFYYNMGVLLKGGSIRSASSGDASTQVTGDKRTTNFSDGELTPEKINDAIDHDSGNNEIVVAEPQIAGFFLDAAQHNDMTAAERAEFTLDLKAKAAELQMPVYIRMPDGKFYHAVSDFSLGEPISVEEILDNDFSLSDDQKRTAREEVFVDCPFKLDLPEQQMSDAWRDGQQALQSDQQFRGGTIKIGRLVRHLPMMVDLSTAVSGIEDYLATRELEYATSQTEFADQLAQGKETNTFGVSIEHLKESGESSHQRMKQDFAFFLHGLAEATEKEGDSANAEKARAFAETLVPHEECTKVIARRLGPDGKFKITEADLKHVTSSNS